MDVRKRFSRLKLKWIAGALALLLVALGGLVVQSYLFAQNIKDPKSCFTTSMYNVPLCPGNNNYVPYRQIPKIFFQTLIISEDAGFYGHEGLDWHELKESMEINWEKGRYVRGASTLTQQLAKNMYLSSRKTLTRKLKEFFIARRLEESLSKSQILEKYVNVVEFGKGIYGIGPASSHYFGKSPSQLNLLESVYLVSLLPNPESLGRSFSKKVLSKSNRWRMKVILKRLYNTKRVSDEMFVYIEMLIEDQDWPFDEFRPNYFLAPEPEMDWHQELSEEMENLGQGGDAIANSYDKSADEPSQQINLSDDSDNNIPIDEETLEFPPPSVDEGAGQEDNEPMNENEIQGEEEPGDFGDQEDL